jgi:murein DD-endopeptidase MepM/ murein hydrolase activator NlpD
MIDAIASSKGVDPNVIGGIIAAESGGKPDSGKGGGYKGLMQARTGNEQLDPETSIRSGVEHFLKKQGAVSRILLSFGINYQKMDPETRLRYVMTAYNAGEGTLKKALEMAQAVGDPRRWQEPEIFHRALLYTGAYSTRASLRWCLNHLGPQEAARALASLTGRDPKTMQNDYYQAGTGWDTNRLLQTLGSSILKQLTAENERLRGDSTLTVGKSRSASPLLMCAVVFKHVHLPIYINNILRYKRFYDQRRKSAREITLSAKYLEQISSETESEHEFRKSTLPASGNPPPAFSSRSLAVLKQKIQDAINQGQITPDFGQQTLKQAQSRVLRPLPKILSGWGWRKGRKGTYIHQGLDLAAAMHTKITAVRKGRIARAGSDPKGFGNYIVLDHGRDVDGNRHYTVYGHNDRLMFQAKDIGNVVEQGQLIALSGNTGLSDGPHLHYEVRVIPPNGPGPKQPGFFSWRTSVDPSDYIWPERLTLD